MKIEKEIKEYFRTEIEKIDIPPCPAPRPGNSSRKENRTRIPLRLAFAAVIAFAFIPLIHGALTPSPLAERAASVCRTYELDTRISEGLLDLHKMASKSFFTEERK